MQIAQRVTNPFLGQPLQDILGGGQGAGISFFQKIIPNAIGLIFVIGTLIFFFMLIIGAVEWIASAGDKAKIESARGRITSALVGIIVLFASFAIIKLIETFFAINILTIDIGVLKIQ